MNLVSASSPLLPHQPVKLHFHAWLTLELMLLPAGVFIFPRSKQCFCHGVSQYPPRVISWKKRPCYWGALEGEPDVHFSKTLKSNFCFWLCCGHGKQPWSGKLAVFVWWRKVISLLNVLPLFSKYVLLLLWVSSAVCTHSDYLHVWLR